MMEWIKQPWPWYFSGILIGLMVPLLKLIDNKPFGISSSLRHICAAVLPTKVAFFNYDWKKEIWNLVFVLGVIIGAFIAANYLTIPGQLNLSAAGIEQLNSLGITDLSGVVPAQLFSFEQLFTVQGFLFTVVGGFLVGFGTRYANGCTSGHSINGLSHLDFSSFIATCCFMIGGIFSSHFIVPYLISI